MPLTPPRPPEFPQPQHLLPDPALGTRLPGDFLGKISIFLSKTFIS